MTHAIMTLQHMAAAPAMVSTLVPIYGDKAAGCAGLLAAQPTNNSVGYYNMPAPARSFGIPAAQDGAMSSDVPARAFDEYVARSAVSERWPHLMRSSAVGEAKQPGRFRSPPILVDPQDIAASRDRFVGTVGELQAEDPSLAVLVMPMIGSWNYADGGNRFGYDNVGFVAETVNPVRPQEMSIFMVRGLGHLAVDSVTEAIIIAVDRAEGGRITFFGNMQTDRVLDVCGTIGASAYRYRQRHISFFESSTEKITNEPYRVSTRLNTQCNLDPSLLRFMGVSGSSLYSPIEGVAALMNLVSALRYVHARFGPSQVEGGLLEALSPYPFLFQRIDPPKTSLEDRPLDAIRRDLHSDEVLGAGRFRGLLVLLKKAEESYYDAHTRTHHGGDYLRDLDRVFGDDGYMLHSQAVERELMRSTPGACIRLTPARMSNGVINYSSHAVTDMRFRAVEGGGTHALVMGVRPSRELYENTFRYKGLTLAVFRDCLLDSNGREAAVQLGQPMTSEEFLGLCAMKGLP